MTKRQLNSKYKDLVDYVNEQKREKVLVSILDDVTRQANDYYNSGNELWNILEKLYVTPLKDNEVTDLVETIIDIYNDNYDLEEPVYYWRFKEITGKFGYSLFAFKYRNDNTIGLKNKSDFNSESDIKMSKTKLDSLLSETNLISDNFTPVEEL